MGRNSAPYLHAITESLKLSFADRKRLRRRSQVRAEHSDAGAAVEGIRGRATRADRPESRIVGEPAPGDPRGMKATLPSGAGYRFAATRASYDVKPFDPDEILNLTTLSRRRRQGSQHGVDHLEPVERLRQRRRRRQGGF
jgi:hypothetical protein